MESKFYTNDYRNLYKNIEQIINEQNPGRSENRKLTYNICWTGKRFFIEPDKRFMLVGRAINGWENDTYEDFVAYNDDNSWDFLTNNDGRTHKRSSFWRTSKLIISELTETENYEYLDYIAWNNLFKMSYLQGGNPKTSDASSQIDDAIKILAYEINALKPKYIMFCTNDYWTDLFLSYSRNNRKNENDVFSLLKNVAWSGWNIETSDECVLTTSELSWNDGLVTKLLISVRPEGRKEKPFSEAVIKAFRK